MRISINLHALRLYGLYGTYKENLFGIARFKQHYSKPCIKDVRIEAPIPGKSTVGVEIPNEIVSPVSLKEILEQVPQNKVNNKLLVALGKNIMGKAKFAEIDKTPHLLVAGSTGSGKSVCINNIHKWFSLLVKRRYNSFVSSFLYLLKGRL